MAAEALHAFAEKKLSDSRSRKWYGPEWAWMRAELRERARLYGDLATRIYYYEYYEKED